MNASEQVLPYKPREVSKIDDAIFRELIFSKRAFAIFPKDPAKKIRFFEASSSNAIDKKFSFSLEAGQEKVDLSIELKPGTLLFKRLEEVGGFESLPEEFRLALMTFVSGEIVEALEYFLQLRVTTLNAAQEQERSGEKKELCFEILDANDLCEARASIMLGLPLLERVLAAAQKIPMLKKKSLTGGLLEGEVLVGSATLSLDDWKSLKPGDLIIIQEPSALATGQGRCLIKKSGIIPMVFKENEFKSLLLPLDNFFPAAAKPSPSASQEVKLEGSIEQGAASGKQLASTSTSDATCPEVTTAITLELNFSAGLLSLTIEEALQLIKTKSIEKPFQISRPLKIFIQERVVGTGEIVEIGGRYALVVTQV